MKLKNFKIYFMTEQEKQLIEQEADKIAKSIVPLSADNGTITIKSNWVNAAIQKAAIAGAEFALALSSTQASGSEEEVKYHHQQKEYSFERIAPLIAALGQIGKGKSASMSRFNQTLTTDDMSEMANKAIEKFKASQPKQPTTEPAGEGEGVEMDNLVDRFNQIERCGSWKWFKEYYPMGFLEGQASQQSKDSGEGIDVPALLYHFMQHVLKNPVVKSYLPLNDDIEYVNEWWEDNRHIYEHSPTPAKPQQDGQG
jgi:hypothetical protein